LKDLKQDYIKISKHEKIINQELQKLQEKHEEEVTRIQSDKDDELCSTKDKI
jgi:cell division protein FtsB